MKYAKITFVATLASVFVMGAGMIYLADGKDDVIISEEVLAGDVTAVEGMTLNWQTSMMGEHTWTLEAPLGNVEETKVDYQYEPEYGYGENEPIFSMNLETNAYICMENGVYDWEDIEVYNKGTTPILAISDVASRATIGTPYTETVLYSDYYDYYPYDIWGSFEGDRYLSEEAQAKIISSCQFPVVEGDALEITVYLDGDGYCEIRYTRDEDSQYISLDTWYVLLEDGIYCAMQMREYDLEITPLSDLDVYYIPFIESEETETEINIGEIEHLGTLPDTMEAEAVTERGEVIVQMLEEPSKYAVVELKDGAYDILLEVEMDDAILEEVMDSFPISMDYEDNRLVQIYEASDAGRTMSDLIVCIYGEEGIIYAGRYHNSQQEEMPAMDSEYEKSLYIESGVSVL